MFSGFFRVLRTGARAAASEALLVLCQETWGRAVRLLPLWEPTVLG